MDWFTKTLLSTASAVQSAWDWIAERGGDALSAVDRMINPILSPVFALLNPIATTVADVVYAIFSPLGVAGGLIAASVAVGVLMLPAFKFLSNQKKIARAKDDIKANLLALKLFKDELHVVFGAQVRILWAILRLQRWVITPILWMLLPMLLVLAQMGVRYQWRPLRVGEASLLRVARTDPKLSAKSMTLTAPPGVTVEAGPVASDKDVVWRLRAKEVGRHTMTLTVDGKQWEKEIVVGEEGVRVSEVRPGASWVDQLFYPCELRLPADAGVQSIMVEYPAPTSWFRGADYWVLSFFVISMIAALLLAPIFKVKF